MGSLGNFQWVFRVLFYFLWLNDLSSQINVTWGGFHNKLKIHATHCVEIADSPACIVWNITIGDLHLMSFWSWKSFLSFFCLLIVIGQLVDRKRSGKERGGHGIRKGLRAKIPTRDAQRAIARYFCVLPTRLLAPNQNSVFMKHKQSSFYSMISNAKNCTKIIYFSSERARLNRHVMNYGFCKIIRCSRAYLHCIFLLPASY